ncbi:MAG: methyltransferase domain-containing protein [Chloroflexi bacterium]|nr:methyltransferase domain-containing protein [Chloroflexota bacterium]
MVEMIKKNLRGSFLRPLYLWLANRYRTLRRLLSYPDTARVGVVDYDVYWDNKAQGGLGQLSPWRRKRAQVFAALVSPGATVLDLGVGDGALLRYLIEQRQVQGYGLDVSPKAVAFCRDQGLKVDLADVNKPLTDYLREPFDYIVLSEIIEHLPDPERLLNDLRPYARQGIIVSIPNTGFYQHRLRLVLGRFPLQWVVTPGEHLRFWTRADFHWWARQLRFRIAAEVPYEGTPLLKNIWRGLFAAGFVYLLSDASNAVKG